MRRADELPLATTLLEQISDLRATAAAARAERWSADLPGQPIGIEMIQSRFKTQFETAESTLREYRAQLVADESDDRIGDIREEENVARQIRLSLDRVRSLGSAAEWGIDDPKHEAIESELAQLQSLSAELPSHLHRRLGVLAGEVRTQYRSLIGLLSVTSLSATALLGVLIRFFYRWVFRPLDVLVKGSRRVAAGEFSYRIELWSRDEMAELACAMNDMTARFQAIRDDLDRQVQVRTRQVVRSEQLASVGFLAAGVAHEINNPLASIAMCAESLESRLAELCRSHSPCADSDPRNRNCRAQGEDGTRSLPAAFDDQLPVIEHYLRMIQSEAFRCKEITEKLLDFSRIGEVKRQHADLGELVAGVIDMVRHLGKYHDRRIVFAGGNHGLADGPVATASERHVGSTKRRTHHRRGKCSGDEASRAELDHQCAGQPRSRGHARGSAWAIGRQSGDRV